MCISARSSSVLEISNSWASMAPSAGSSDATELLMLTWLPLLVRRCAARRGADMLLSPDKLAGRTMFECGRSRTLTSLRGAEREAQC